MRNICAYLLASMGNNSVNVDNLKNILASVGVEADETQLKIVIEKFAGKPVEKVIAQGNGLLSATGGGGAAAAPKAAAGGAAAAAAPKEEEKKEEKEESEESDDDMGFGLFD